MYSVVKILLLLVPMLKETNSCGLYVDTQCAYFCGPHTCNANDEYLNYCWNMCGPGIQNGRGFRFPRYPGIRIRPWPWRPIWGGRPGGFREIWRVACVPPEMAIRDRCGGPFYCSLRPLDALPEKPRCGARAHSDQYPDGTWSPCMQCLIG